MRRWKRPLLILVALTLLAAAAAALFGPGLLRDRATAWVKTETGRSLEIGKVSVNLLALSVEIRDVTLTEADQTTPFVSWERLYVALSPRSLWHLAPVVRELQLDKPAVRIERRPEGRFNFSDLLESKEAEPPPAKGEKPARYSLNNLVIHGGRIEVIDLTLATPATHRVEALELALPFVGNLPYLADRYVKPLLQANINGTPFELKGELKPFADAQEYLLKFKFDGIDLPRYLAYLPQPLPVTVHNGRLDLDLDLSYRTSASVEPVLELAGRIDLTTLDLRERDGRPLLFIPLLEARLAPSHPLDKEFHLALLSVRNPQGWLTRDTAGRWNVSSLGGASSNTVEEDTSDEEVPPPLRLTMDRVRLQDGRLGIRDNQPAGGFATTLNNINLDVDGLTLANDTPFKATLDLASERREHASISGELSLNPFRCDLDVTLTGIPLPPYAPYYLGLYATALQGTADAKAHLKISPEQPLLISAGRMEGRDLSMPFAPEEGLRMSRLVYDGIAFDLGGNRLEIADVTMEGADLRFSRSRQGQWSILSGNFPLLAKLAEPAESAPAPEPEQTPFSYRIGRIALHDAKVDFRDELPAEPTRFSIAGLGVTIRDLASADKTPASFDIQGTFQKKGEFQASGSLLPTVPEVDAKLQLRRIPLVGFAPYLDEKVRVVLIDGALDTSLSAKVTRQGDGWRGRIDGDLGIGRFYCLDADHREDLLRWERLQLGGIDVRLEPLSFKVASIAVNDYYARVLLDEQARLNLVQIFNRHPAADGTAADPAVTESTEPSAAAAVPSSPAAARPEVRIGKITLQGGTVNFTDRHMPKPFSAEMLQLGGRIEGLSSIPGSRAEVDLRGRLRNESPLSIAGTLNPLADPLFLNLKLDFTDIDLSPLSPYSGTYVGYLIERGKLNVALEYLVENGRLKASNKLFLDQFTFGDKVESDKATSLPVRLAVALLKDRKGEIHLDIPVSGNIDDPRFSVWGIVWQIVRNLLVKAVTSPLALLGALGGGGEDFSAIVFPAGSMRLTETEQAKLGKIAGALRDRPELKLEVKGYVDPEQDPEGYRRELLQQKLCREKLIDLRKKQGDAAPADIDAVVVGKEEYPDYLWRVYKATDFPKPRNLIGLVKHLPDEELEKLLLANTRIGTEELTTLAQARAQAVAAALAAGGVPRDRLFLATTEITAMPATEGVSRSRVEFGMAVK